MVKKKKSQLYGLFIPVRGQKSASHWFIYIGVDLNDVHSQENSSTRAHQSRLWFRKNW